jgi:hypothetical protein
MNHSKISVALDNARQLMQKYLNGRISFFCFVGWSLSGNLVGRCEGLDNLKLGKKNHRYTKVISCTVMIMYTEQRLAKLGPVP